MMDTNHFIQRISLFFFRENKQIEIRDVNDLKKVLHSHSMAPQGPALLYAATPLTIMYLDANTKPYSVHWLNLTDVQSKIAAGKGVIHIELDDTSIRDMCLVQEGDKQIVVVAGGDGGLFAYDTETGKLEWKVKEKPSEMMNAINTRGVTTDGHGHLFVCNTANECIQMFSASDGQYLGRLMRGVETIGYPAKVHWNAETSTLAAACLLQGKWHLQLINIQY